MGAEEYPVAGGMDSGYKFEFRPDGIYLTIYPSEEDSFRFELSDMRQILRDCGIIDYDIAERLQVCPVKLLNPLK